MESLRKGTKLQQQWATSLETPALLRMGLNIQPSKWKTCSLGLLLKSLQHDPSILAYMLRGLPSGKTRHGRNVNWSETWVEQALQRPPWIVPTPAFRTTLPTPSLGPTSNLKPSKLALACVRAPTCIRSVVGVRLGGYWLPCSRSRKKTRMASTRNKPVETDATVM